MRFKSGTKVEKILGITKKNKSYHRICLSLRLKLKKLFLFMWLQLLFVLLAIIVGARVGGIGLGVFGGLGLAVAYFCLWS